MKKSLFLVLLLVLGFFLFKTIRNKVKQDLTQIIPYPSVSVSPPQRLAKRDNAEQVTINNEQT